jgi:hypothetical protein
VLFHAVVETAEIVEGETERSWSEGYVVNVRVESDGCYWYRYVGPVEVTYLPLLTRDDG